MIVILCQIIVLFLPHYDDEVDVKNPDGATGRSPNHITSDSISGHHILPRMNVANLQPQIQKNL